MKKMIAFVFVTVFALSSVQAGAISVPVATGKPAVTKLSVADAFAKMDAKTFLALTPAKVKEMTGKKMKLGQKISLKIAQMEVKKQLKKGKEVNMAEMSKRADGSGFNWGAAALGFFLGLIGILIVYLAFKKDKEVARKSGWIGLAVWLAVWLIVFVI